MNLFYRIVITLLVGGWLAMNAFVKPIAQVVDDPPPPVDAFAAAKREVWEQLLQLGNFDPTRHAMLLDPEPMGIGRYRVRAMSTSATPGEPDVVLAEATWQEAARYQSEMANLYANRYREVMPNFVSGAFHYIAGTLEYQGRMRDVWAMVQDLTLIAVGGETVRLVAFIPAGLGTLSFVVSEAYDAATIGMRGSDDPDPDSNPFGPQGKRSQKSSSDGYVDPRYKCSCPHALPPNNLRKWIDTEELPGPGPSQPPLPIPNLAGDPELPPTHWQRVIWPDPNPFAIVERNECRSRCWRDQMLNMILAGSISAGWVAGCMAITATLGTVFCITGAGIAAGITVAAILRQVETCQETCNVIYCQIVARDSKRTWIRERDSFTPQLVSAQAAREDVQRDINNIYQRIADAEDQLASTPPGPRRDSLMEHIRQLRQQLEAVQIRLREAEERILTVLRAREPSQNKVVAVDACIQTPLGADR